MKEDCYQALASPVRREIIAMLKWQSMSAGEIGAHFDISQPSVSRHLDILKQAEIVTAERRANQVIYSLNLSVAEELYLKLTELLGRAGNGAPAFGGEGGERR